MSKELVQKILDGRNWTLPEMAEHIGVNHSTAWRWLHKGIPPSKPAMKLLEQEEKRIERVRGTK